MDVRDMTPDQLREYAIEKERAERATVAKYMGDDAPSLATATPLDAPKPEPRPDAPYIQRVTVDGVAYPVDMRRVKSREFVRAFARYQRHQLDGTEAPIEETLDLYDIVFRGECDELVTDIVREKRGFDDFEEIMRVETAILEGIDAKN